MSYTPNANIDVTRNVLYAEEATYGTTPINVTWINAGIANTLTWKKSPAHQTVDILGSIDSYGEYRFGNDYTVELKYYFNDTALLKYGTELPVATGTIAKGLSMMVSKKLNGVENWKIFKGCITESCTLDYSKIPLITQTFRCSNISDWMTSAEVAAVIGSTPAYPAALSADPWTSLDAGTTSPLQINSINYDIAKFTFTVSRSILIQQPIGQPDPIQIRAGKRKITASFTTWEKDNVLENAVEGFTSYPMVLTVNSGKTATFAGMRLISAAGGEDAGATSFDTYDYTMMAKTVTVT
jgi:hypothetical protein